MDAHFQLAELSAKVSKFVKEQDYEPVVALAALTFVAFEIALRLNGDNEENAIEVMCECVNESNSLSKSLYVRLKK